VFLLFSCAKEAQEVNYITISSKGDPIELKHDEEILSSADRDNVRMAESIFGHKGSSKCASTSLVSHIFQGGEFDWIKVERGYMETVQSSPREYLFCNPNSILGSFNHATTSIIQSLKETENLISYTDYIFPKIELRVAPLISEVQRRQSGNTYYDKREFLVNNAFYTNYPMTNRKHKYLMTFLPQGKTAFGVPFSGVMLWNIPFVPSHEYGHHIFSQLFKNESLVKGHACFNTVIAEEELKPADSAKVVRSLNEAFADVIGQLSHNKKENFKGVNCFEKIRDIHSSSYADGEQKKLTSRFLQKFLNPSYKVYTSCNQTLHPRIHHFGATLARGIYKLIEHLPIEQKMEALFSWVEQMGKAIQAHHPPKYSLKVALELLLDNVYDKSNMDKRVCAQFNKYFPVFATNKCL
jgi:hypothetical protein